MRARAPASSANLGPGFDTLAVALDLYVSVDIEEAPALRVHSEGEGAGLFDDASHLAARVASEVLGHDRFAVTVRSDTTPACIELEIRDAWVWDMYRPARFVPEVRVVTFRDVNIERLPEQEL